MDYKNDNRTPRDRITGEFLSELLFTDLGGDCDCKYAPRSSDNCTCERNARTTRSKYETDAVSASTNNARMETRRSNSMPRNSRCENRGGGNVEFSGNYSLAMAYVPMQEFADLFDIEEGFCEGTIFRALRFPFYPTPCRKENDFHE